MIAAHHVADTEYLVSVDTELVKQAKKEKASTDDRLQLCFVLDYSYSMSGPKIDSLVRAMRGLVPKLPDGSSLSVVTFHETPTVLFHSLECHARERSELEACFADQGANLENLGPATNLSDALHEAAKLVAKHPDPWKTEIVVLTDGMVNRGVEDPTALAALASGVGGKVHSVMFTQEASADFSKRLFEVNPSNTAHFVANSDDLESAFRNIFGAIERDELKLSLRDKLVRTVPSRVAQGVVRFLVDVADVVDVVDVVDVAEADDAVFELSASDVVVATGKFATLKDVEVVPSIEPKELDLHVRVARAYDRVAKAAEEVRASATGADDATNASNAASIAESFSPLFDEVGALEEEFVKVELEASPQYRSLGAVVEHIKKMTTPSDDASADASAASADASAASADATFGESMPVYRSLSACAHTPRSSPSVKHAAVGMPSL